MKYLHLVWAALFRRKARTMLTLLSIVVAFLLFALLDTVHGSFANSGQSVAGHDRLAVLAKMRPILDPLPLSLYDRIKEVPGVTGIEYSSSLVGTYQNPQNQVVVETHPDSFYDLYPELAVAPAARLAMQRTRTGVLAGEAIARKYNWKVGDKIPLESPLVRKDGSKIWTFDVVGTYRFTEPGMKVWENMLYGNWNYLDESRASDNGTVLYFTVKAASLSQVDQVAHAIDAISANSDHETKTQSENALMGSWISQIGDLGLIVTSIMGAVFFTLLLLTGHTMTQAVQERIPELAILKTVGFSGRSVLGLVLSESILLLLLGSTLGLALATLAVHFAPSIPSDSLPIPIQAVAGEIWLQGLTFAILIGLVVGALPALHGRRLRIVDALSGR